jgi:hypothetical protein
MTFAVNKNAEKEILFNMAVHRLLTSQPMNFWAYDPMKLTPIRFILKIVRLKTQNLYHVMIWPGYLSRYSDWLRAGRRRGRSLSSGGVKNFLFSMLFSQALGPTQPSIQ